VIEFAVGLFHTVVKVGRTNSPRVRASQHDRDVSRFGGTIRRAWLSDPHWYWRTVEKRLIHGALMLGGVPLAGEEYYTDLAYENLVELAGQLVAEAPELKLRPNTPFENAASHVELTKESKLVLRRILDSYRSGNWRGYGAGTWEDFCAQHLPDLRDIHWSLDQRHEVVRRLRRQGLSIRGIGTALGLSTGTIQNTLKLFQDVGTPEEVLSLDGRYRPSRAAAGARIPRRRQRRVLPPLP
jgi:uncharacterized protein YerC